MMNKLNSVQRNTRLVRIWAPTSRFDRTLTCKWVEASKVQAVTAASSSTEEGGMQLCA